MSRTHVKECIQVLLEHNLITKVVRPGKTSVYIFDVIDSEDLEKPDDMPCADPVATRPTEPSTRSPHDLHPVATRPTTRSPRDHVKDIYIINKNLKERERDAPPLTPFEQVSQNLIDDYTTEVIRMRLMNQYPTLRGNEPMILDETEARVRNIWRVEFDKGNPSAKSQGYGSKLALTVWLDVARDYTRGKSKKDNGNNTLEDKLALLRTGR